MNAFDRALTEVSNHPIAAVIISFVAGAIIF